MSAVSNRKTYYNRNKGKVEQNFATMFHIAGMIAFVDDISFEECNEKIEKEGEKFTSDLVLASQLELFKMLALQVRKTPEKEGVKSTSDLVLASHLKMLQDPQEAKTTSAKIESPKESCQNVRAERRGAKSDSDLVQTYMFELMHREGLQAISHEKEGEKSMLDLVQTSKLELEPLPRESEVSENGKVVADCALSQNHQAGIASEADPRENGVSRACGPQRGRHIKNEMNGREVADCVLSRNHQAETMKRPNGAEPTDEKIGSFNDVGEMHSAVRIHETDPQTKGNLVSDEPSPECTCVQELTVQIAPETKGDLTVVLTSPQGCCREAQQTEVVEKVSVLDQHVPLREVFDPGGQQCDKNDESRGGTARGWRECKCHQQTERGRVRTVFDPGKVRASATDARCRTHLGFGQVLKPFDPGMRISEYSFLTV